MNFSERVAKATVEALTAGARMSFRSQQSDGSYDFDLSVNGVLTGAVEVTTATDQKKQAMLGALFNRKRNPTVNRIPCQRCRSAWYRELMENASVNDIRKSVDAYLAAVEADGITQFVAGEASVVKSVARITRVLKIESGRALPELEGKFVYIEPPVACGWLDSRQVLKAICTEMKKEDNRKKLQLSGRRERHLFVYVDPNASGAHSALANYKVPDRRFKIPSEMTQIWAVARSFGSGEYVVSTVKQGEVWQSCRLELNESTLEGI